MSRFDYVKYDPHSVDLQAKFKRLFMDIEGELEDYFPLSGDGPTEYDRSKALVLNHLEISYMWIGKAIRDHQREFRGARLNEERNNS